MCQIRVIIKRSDSEVVYDNVHNVETTVNPLDRPTYVEMEGKVRYVLTFYYTGSVEKYKKLIINNDMEISYGILSGRISQFCTKHNRVEGTDNYAVIKQLINSDVTPRFDDNIKEGLKLVNSLLLLFKELRDRGVLERTPILA